MQSCLRPCRIDRGTPVTSKEWDEAENTLLRGAGWVQRCTNSRNVAQPFGSDLLDRGGIATLESLEPMLHTCTHGSDRPR